MENTISRPWTIDEAADFIRKSKSTIYRLVGLKKIPHHKQGNRLYFFPPELIEWIKSS